VRESNRKSDGKVSYVANVREGKSQGVKERIVRDVPRKYGDIDGQRGGSGAMEHESCPFGWAKEDVGP